MAEDSVADIVVAADVTQGTKHLGPEGVEAPGLLIKINQSVFV